MALLSTQKLRASREKCPIKYDMVDNMKRDMIMVEQGVASTVYGHLSYGRANRIAGLKIYVEYGSKLQKSEGKFKLLNLRMVPPPQ